MKKKQVFENRKLGITFTYFLYLNHLIVQIEFSF